MLENIVTIVLIISLCVVALAAIGAVLFMRSREQARERTLQAADALAQLDNALNTALTELNKMGNLVQKEIGEKYQAMLFMYNLMEEKQRSLQVIAPPEQLALPEQLILTQVAETHEPVKPETVEADAVLEEPAEPHEPAEVPEKPAPRKRKSNPKHKKVHDMHEQGMSVAEIAKEMGIGQGEITLILGMTGEN